MIPHDRKRAVPAFPFLFLFLSLSFPLWLGCTPRIVRDGEIRDDLAATVKERTAEVRHLAFLKPVPTVLVDEAEVRRYIQKKMDEEMPEEKQRAMVKAYAKLGVLPAGFDYHGVVLRLLLKQVAGYYEPDEKKLFVVAADLPGGILVSIAEWIARRDIRGEFVLSHELTHALQDQHFNLDPFLDVKDDDDERLARQSVAEGDATVAAMLELVDSGDPESLHGIDLKDVMKLAGEDPSMAGLPQIIVQSLVFPYVGGSQLVMEALTRGGWEAVNAMYADPPISSEQILHVEKYLRPGAERDRPLPVARPAPGTWLDGWKEIETNVEGELTCRIFFEQYLGPDPARVASEGWGGDRFVAYEGPAGEVAIFWRTRWDSERDAQEYASAYEAVLAKKIPTATRIGDKEEPFALWSAGRELVFLERRGDEVMISEGLPSSWSAEEVRARVWHSG